MATTKTAPKKTATNAALAAASTPADDANLPKFPRQMKLVNDTAQPWVIGGTYVAPGSSAPHTVRDEDALKRHRTDCEYILSVSDHYKPVEPEEGETAAPNALRIEELDDEAEMPTAAESDGATA